MPRRASIEPSTQAAAPGVRRAAWVRCARLCMRKRHSSAREMKGRDGGEIGERQGRDTGEIRERYGRCACLCMRKRAIR